MKIMPDVAGATGVIASAEKGERMPNLFCDNYSQCQGMMLDRGNDLTNESHARAKGWHIYKGHSMGGSVLEGVLCPRCVGAHRRRLDPAPPLQPGQRELFEIEVVVDPEA